MQEGKQNYLRINNFLKIISTASRSKLGVYKMWAVYYRNTKEKQNVSVCQDLYK